MGHTVEETEYLHRVPRALERIAAALERIADSFEHDDRPRGTDSGDTGTHRRDI